MRMTTSLLSGALALLLLASGCESVQNIDMDNDTGHAVMALDYRDFQAAADELVQSLLASGALRRQDGGRYVMTTGRIVNDTMQRINTNQLMAKIEEAMLNSGQVVMTAAVGGEGAPDAMVHEVRQLRQDEEFNQGTIAQKGTLIAPDMSISGLILQRDVRYSRTKTQVEYYFQLRVSSITTGLVHWQRETIIGKRGSSKSVSW
jgi:uncharacterized protein (TIGR02722 family)